jgi:hypothetical protein
VLGEQPDPRSTFGAPLVRWRSHAARSLERLLHSEQVLKR